MIRTADTRAEVRSELRRILELLQAYLQLQRENGRTAATDPLRGMAIEEGEAERLIHDIAADLTRPYNVSEEASEDVVPDLNESPLGRARRRFRMQSTEFDALLLAVAVELDSRFARIVAYLNDHILRTRPTIGLALALTGADMNAVEFVRRPCVRHGLLQTEGDGPVSGLALRVASEFLPRLVTPDVADTLIAGVRLHDREALPLDDLIAGPAQLDKLKYWAGCLSEMVAVRPIVLAGPSGVGRATAAMACSAVASRPLVEVTWTPDRADRSYVLAGAVREALWHDATLLVRMAEGSKDSDVVGLWTSLSDAHVPVALAVFPDQTELVCSAAPVEPIVIHLEGATIEQREALWRKLLSAEISGVAVRVSDDERTELAARYDFLPGTLSRAIRRAAAEHSGDSAPLGFDSLSRACRIVGSAAIGPIAQRLSQPYTRSDLVLPQALLDELDLAAAWTRNRRRVFEDWGFGRRIALGRGLTALFSGDPGTGKTMTAQVLARELGLDLYRVDLSRVMSKYIGETEKNLSRLFDDARASGAILFFDEADALFGKRTEVKDAHDRYANIEIGYLLQRMEEHTGTTILATNRVGDLDEAFTRRFHFILDFPMPRAPERRRIWEGMLPAEAEREPDLDLDTLSRDYEISGGEIRNSVLSAAFVAAEEGVPIGLRHLKRGLRRELLKTGRVLDGRQRRALEGE